jgi:hypothetical protein
MWKEAFELRTGNQNAAARLARLVINQQRLHKRDTIADFWSRRLHDMQLRDDPVETGYGQGAASPSVAPKQEYAPPTQKQVFILIILYILKLFKEYGSSYSSQPQNVYGSSSTTTQRPQTGYGQDQYVETPSMGCCSCQRGRPGPPGKIQVVFYAINLKFEASLEGMEYVSKNYRKIL